MLRTDAEARKTKRKKLDADARKLMQQHFRNRVSCNDAGVAA
jgi:hypothetical protein